MRKLARTREYNRLVKVKNDYLKTLTPEALIEYIKDEGVLMDIRLAWTDKRCKMCGVVYRVPKHALYYCPDCNNKVE